MSLSGGYQNGLDSSFCQFVKERCPPRMELRMSVNLGTHSPRMKVAKRTEKLGTHISALFFFTATRIASATFPAPATW